MRTCGRVPSSSPLQAMENYGDGAQREALPGLLISPHTSKWCNVRSAGQRSGSVIEDRVEEATFKLKATQCLELGCHLGLLQECSGLEDSAAFKHGLLRSATGGHVALPRA